MEPNIKYSKSSVFYLRFVTIKEYFLNARKTRGADPWILLLFVSLNFPTQNPCSQIKTGCSRGCLLVIHLHACDIFHKSDQVAKMGLFIYIPRLRILKS